MREIPFDLPVKELESEIPQLTSSDKRVKIMKTKIFGDKIETEVAYNGKNRPFVVFCHGFPGNEKNRDIAYELFQKGVSTAIVKYRGVENSGGEFKFTGAVYDIKSAMSDLHDKYGLREDNMALVGYSYGGLFSINLCYDKPDIKNLVCISPVVNLEKFLKEGTIGGILRDGVSKVRGSLDSWKYQQSELKQFNDPAKKMVVVGQDSPLPVKGPDGKKRDTYSGKTMIERLNLDSLLVVHGTYDDDVSMAHSRILFDGANAPKKSLGYIPIAGHDYVGARRKLIKVVSDHLVEVFS